MDKNQGEHGHQRDHAQYPKDAPEYDGSILSHLIRWFGGECVERSKSEKLGLSSDLTTLGHEDESIGEPMMSRINSFVTFASQEIPASDAKKYFAAIEVLACTENRDWLSHAARAISKHWATKNRPRTKDREEPV